MSKTATAYDWQEQETQVNQFVDRFDNPAYRLLVDYAALPLVLTPELVHYLRTEFLRDQDVPWEAEVDLLLSNLCTQVGYELYAMDTQVRAYVLAQMQEDEVWQQRKQAVAQVLISYVNILSRVDPNRRVREREAQRWAAMMYFGDTQCQAAVQEIAERLKQLGDRADAGADAEHSIRAELARLTRIAQEMASELRDGASSSLLDYAELVQTVLRRPNEVDLLAVQQSYQVGDVELTVSSRMLPEQLEIGIDRSGLEAFPPLQVLEFETGQCVVEQGTGFPELVERSVEVITLIPEDDQMEESAIASDDLEQDAANDLGIVLRSFSFDVVMLGGAPERETKQGELYEEPLGDDGVLEMVSIPAGRFMMGSPVDEPKRLEREEPQHEVAVPPFFMGRYPVTQEQWLFVASNLPEVEQELEPEPSSFKGENHPVEQVSWDDAIEFCQRLSQYTQKTYRLPSEAEWEYACRAGTTSPFHFGDTISPDIANYFGPISYNGGPTGEHRKKTVPVDHFQIANGFGLSDMHGNVWEWCQDHWHKNYKGTPPNDGGAWLEDPLHNNRRVRRGGSWDDDPQDCRSAFRGRDIPDFRNGGLGFRVVASAPRTQ